MLRAQGLPPVPVPPGNPLLPERIVLGKILFFEEQISGDNTTACATCHMPEAGGGDPRVASPLNTHPGPDGILSTEDDIQGSRGVVHCDSNQRFSPDGFFFPKAQVTPRKAPSAIGAAWDPELFWDGRAGGVFLDPVSQAVALPSGAALESQAVGPPVSGEMGCDGNSMAAVTAKLTGLRPLRLATNLPVDVAAALQAHPTYPDLFAAAFGDPAITPARFAMAVASYERTLVPDQTPFDAFQAGNTAALTADQQAGLALFMGAAACNQCHTPPLFTDHTFRNIGVRPVAEDTGRFAVTGNPADLGRFKVPGLRNAALRAPYFHNGSEPSLAAVILFYGFGGNFNENLDPLITPIGFTPLEINQLDDFLTNGLLDPRVALALPPFDRPTLNSERPANPVLFGAGMPGSGGLEPVMVAPIPPVIGASRFELGLARALGGALAVLAVAGQPAIPSTTWLAAPIHLAIDSSTFFLPVILGGTPGLPGAGFGSVAVEVPDDPALAGRSLAVQWGVLDPGLPASFAVSGAAILTFFAP